MQKKNELVYRITILFLGVLVLLVSFLWQTSRQSLKEVTQEREIALVMNQQLQYELDSVLDDYYRVRVEYDSILFEKDSIIQANARQIQNLITRQEDYYRIRRQLNLLRDITQNYVREIDSLYTANQVLRAENIEMREQILQVQRRTTELTRDKAALETKVEAASVLRAYQIETFPFRLRGRGREDETDRASRAEQIRVCFLISENPIIAAGDYNIYMRIADPNGIILRESDDLAYSFIHIEDTLQYSVKDRFSYQNRQLHKCMTWQRVEEFEPGYYTISLFTDEFLLGETSLELR
ncbi:MAG: hypothetical protein RG741_04510 [Bacteroidales bacterium]|nr:hypothetical protein [Bacteroidales bacterium]